MTDKDDRRAGDEEAQRKAQAWLDSIDWDGVGEMDRKEFAPGGFIATPNMGDVHGLQDSLRVAWQMINWMREALEEGGVHHPTCEVASDRRWQAGSGAYLIPLGRCTCPWVDGDVDG